MFDLLMIKYAELNTKGGNKKYFIRKLEGNIIKKLSGFSDLLFSANKDRILIKLNRNNSEDIISILQKTPGIQNISPAYKVADKTYSAIENKVKEILPQLDKKTFRIETIRADKNFELNSIEVCIKLGKFVENNSKLKVDLKNFDHKIKVEIRDNGVFIYLSTFKGLGGMPVDTSSNVISLLSGGIDSPVASFKMIKRGIHVDFLHFASPPSTTNETKEKVISLAKKVAQYGGKCKLHIIDFMEIQTEIYCGVDERYRITLMRRLFYKIAKQLANQIGALAIVTGESVGQVASQTLESIHATSSDLPITIFRPLISENKEDIIKTAKEIGTYELSISKGEDCCSLFVPKRPIIKPIYNYTKEQEENLLIDNMVRKAIDNREIKEINPGE